MRPFVRYYDILYAHKDYAAEVRGALDLLGFTNHGQGAVLEIGAGTGNHTRELARIFREVWAVEPDADMAAAGIAKTADIENVVWHRGTIDQTPSDRKASAACALFNVVNYIVPPSGFESLLEGLRLRMTPEAGFVFDCWNGDSFLAGGIAPEMRAHKLPGGGSIEQTIETSLDLSRDTATIRYTLHGVDQDRIVSGQEEISIRLWKRREIERTAKDMGFRVEAIRDWKNPGENASPESRRLWWVLRRER